jgi:ribonuclease HII
MNSDITQLQVDREDSLLAFERSLWARGFRSVAGVDEAGRGPLAGPVVAAAVIMPVGICVHGVDDSKKLSPRRREELFDVILKRAAAVGIGIVHHDVIDQINILNATLEAMRLAIEELDVVPEQILVDGNRTIRMNIPCTAIVDGDARCSAIAAASIVAKGTRDRLMRDYDLRYPGYDFAKHKGYGTRGHREAIMRLGLCPIHRRSFAVKPVEGIHL